MSQELEIAFVDKLDPIEYLPLDEVKAEPVGSLFWSMSRGMQRIVAYAGDADFVGIDVDINFKNGKKRVGFVTAKHRDALGIRELGESLKPIQTVGILPEGISPVSRAEPLMQALIKGNVDFLSAYVDWCQGGVVRKVFEETESYDAMLGAASKDLQQLTGVLDGLENGTLKFANQVVYFT